MIDRIPSGTRDVLPDEMRELRAITERLRAQFEGAGYGEVYTPALEYEGTLARGVSSATIPAYRVFDESGQVLVLRSDMTVPIARVVATRYPTAELPLRFAYFANCYRAARPQRHEPREFLQAANPPARAAGRSRQRTSWPSPVPTWVASARACGGSSARFPPPRPSGCPGVYTARQSASLIPAGTGPRSAPRPAVPPLWQRGQTAARRWPGTAVTCPDAVLDSLLHVHFVRAVAIDFPEEAICRYLARTAALTWTARGSQCRP